MSENNPIAEFFNKETRKTIFALFIASLVVGALMSFFGLEPLDILEGLSETARKLYENLNAVVSKIITWTILGATVVIPLWLIFTLPRRVKRKKQIGHRQSPNGSGTGAPTGQSGTE